MSSGHSGSAWYAVPALAGVGWIPYYLKWQDIPEDVAYWQSRTRLYDVLFDSGNRDPADDLGPPVPNDGEAAEGGGYAKMLKEQEYRGAFFLDKVRMRIGSYGLELDRSPMLHLPSVGVTPLRYRIRQRKRAISLLKELPGVGGQRPSGGMKIDEGRNQITITYGVDFRICKMLQAAGGLITFNLRNAPFAWMEMKLTIDRDLTYTVFFSGSAVPSQKLYVDWQLAPALGGGFCEYDMKKASVQEMEDFLQAGGKFTFRDHDKWAAQRSTGPLVHTGPLRKI